MKEKISDIEGPRIKVGLDQQKPLSSSSSVKVNVSTESPKVNSSKEGSNKNTLFANSNNEHSNNGANNNSSTSNNFDDDYNEWDISIGDLIIDLDADIERQSEGDKSSPDCPNKSDTTKNLPGTSKVVSPNSKQFADIGDPVSVMSSNLKSNRLSSLTSGSGGSSAPSNSPINANHPSSLAVSTTPIAGSTTNGTPQLAINTPHHHHSHNQRNAFSVGANSITPGNNSSTNSLVEHHATVDKGLKMKIKRKNIGGKISETKHEIVSSDISPQACKPYLGSYDQNSNPLPNVASNIVSMNLIHGPNSLSSSNSVIPIDGDGIQPNSIGGDLSVLMTAKSSKHSTKNKSAHRDKKDKIKFDKEKVNLPSTLAPTTTKVKPALEENTDSVALSSSSQSGISNLTLKYSSTLSPTVILKPDETQRNTPNTNNTNINIKKAKEENDESISEKKSVGTTTSIATITEPECLGPCEPGTSVTLEGIVWQETEGGVLVVNVTWRGKTYVGTLLDCTKHDWAPPRMCDSPTSDIESKSIKNTRGKRARNSFATDNSIDTRSVTSKLRNGKGRRTANSGYVPPSPAKSDSSLNSSKRKGRPNDLDLSTMDDATKRNRVSKPDTSEVQPSSPVLIECPEPNCSKKYKHINGLKYHQSHAHMGSTFNINDSQDFDNNISETVVPSLSKEDLSDNELNDAGMSDLGINEHSNVTEKLKNPIESSGSCKMESNFNNNTLKNSQTETKMPSNSANDELTTENNKILKSSELSVDELNLLENKVIDNDKVEHDKTKLPETKATSIDPTSDFVNSIPHDLILSSNGVDPLPISKITSLKSGVSAPTDILNTNKNAAVSNNKDEIVNVPSPAYSDISDDTNNNNDSTEFISNQALDKNDSSLEPNKSQPVGNFSLSSIPSYFSQSQFVASANSSDSKPIESTTKSSNESKEQSSNLLSEKTLQNSYSYPFYNFSSMSSHDSKNISESSIKPSTFLESQASSSLTNKSDADLLVKDKTFESNKSNSNAKENSFSKQPIEELQSLKNRIQNFALDQPPFYETSKRFIPDSEHSSKLKDKPKHSPQQSKPHSIGKEEKEKNNEEGVKPTTSSGPPPPTNGYYYNPSFLTHAFSPMNSFDMFRGNSMVMGSPYGPPPGSFLHSPMRFGPMGSLEGLSMAGVGPPPPPLPARSSAQPPTTLPTTTTSTSGKPNSHSMYNSNHKPERPSILSPTSNPNSTPTSSHPLTSSSAYHKSPSKPIADFNPTANSSNHVSASSVNDQRNSLATVSGSMHQPRHPMHSSHVTYPIFDPYSAMIVNHASSSVPMHPFTPK